MPQPDSERLRSIKTLPALIAYLRDGLGSDGFWVNPEWC